MGSPAPFRGPQAPGHGLVRTLRPEECPIGRFFAGGLSRLPFQESLHEWVALGFGPANYSCYKMHGRTPSPLGRPLTFSVFNDIVPPEISVDGEEPATRRAERGPLGERVLRQAAAVPLLSGPGRPGRDLPLQRTRAALPRGSASRVEPWSFLPHP